MRDLGDIHQPRTLVRGAPGLVDPRLKQAYFVYIAAFLAIHQIRNELALIGLLRLHSNVGLWVCWHMQPRHCAAECGGCRRQPPGASSLGTVSHAATQRGWTIDDSKLHITVCVATEYSSLAALSITEDEIPHKVENIDDRGVDEGPCFRGIQLRTFC